MMEMSNARLRTVIVVVRSIASGAIR